MGNSPPMRRDHLVQTRRQTVRWVTTPPPSESEYSYNVISRGLAGSRQHYAFLDRLDADWHIVSRPNISEDASAGVQLEPLHEYHTFGGQEPILEWTNGGQLVQIYANGVDHEAFLNATGLQLYQERVGRTKLHKRISRVMRPYFLEQSFDADEVQIDVMSADDFRQALGVELLDKEALTVGEKVFDGAGVVSRRFLEKMLISEKLPPRKQAQLSRELRQSERFEFTIMTEQGQFKGHAVVNEDMEADFLVPPDIKDEIRLENGETWVALNPVHGKDHMRIDIQSIMNMQGFFTPDMYDTWLNDEITQIKEAFVSGDMEETLRKIDNLSTMDELVSYAPTEFLVSGGRATESRHIAHHLLNRFTKTYDNRDKGKINLPTPGGRYYVLTDAVARVAGRADFAVPRGQAEIDGTTLWVNHEDWLQLQGADAGIAEINGGADHDDAYWVHAFEDYDGKTKLLGWRSPNQPGEYVVLEPTENSRIPLWKHPDGEQILPKNDSRKLMQRIDKQTATYLDLVKDYADVGKGEAYQVGDARITLQQTAINQHVLGQMCNYIMWYTASYGEYPRVMADRLENVIDSVVKNGGDLRQVQEWIYEDTHQRMTQGIEVPRLVQSRVSQKREEGKRTRYVPATNGHWVDQVDAIVDRAVTQLTEFRDEQVAAARPADAVFNAVMQEGLLREGKEFNQVHAQVTRRVRKSPGMLDEQGRFTQDARNQIAQELETHLASYSDSHTERAVLRAAYVSGYLDDKNRKDSAVWTTGIKTEFGQKPGVAQKTLEALREVGVIGEVVDTDSGIVVFHQPDVPQVRQYKKAQIKDFWYHKARLTKPELDLPENVDYQAVPKDMQKVYKQDAIVLAENGGLAGIQVRVAVEPDGTAFINNMKGQRVGRLFHLEESLASGDVIELRAARGRDGTLNATYERIV